MFSSPKLILLNSHSDSVKMIGEQGGGGQAWREDRRRSRCLMGQKSSKEDEKVLEMDVMMATQWCESTHYQRTIHFLRLKC